MTPAQLDSLLTQHRYANDPKSRPASQRADAGSVADLLSLARMKVTV